MPAERAVKFGSDYNAVITHDLKRKADVMHLVEETRRECPKATKSGVTSPVIPEMDY